MDPSSNHRAKIAQTSSAGGAKAEQNIHNMLQSLRENIEKTKEREKVESMKMQTEVKRSNGLEVKNKSKWKDLYTSHTIKDIEMDGLKKQSAESESPQTKETKDVSSKIQSENNVSKTKEDFLGLLAALQFATVVLITRERLPVAGTIESFVVFSMLFLTAGLDYIN